MLNHLKLNFIYFLAVLICLSSQVLATPTWSRLHSQHGINTSSHAFCFRANSGEILGSNIHKKVRTASVSKLITTLWAMERKGPNFQYETKVYYKDGQLFIEGSRDTVFSRRKLFYLVNQLNHYGIEKIEELRFDDQTLVFANAEGYVDQVLTITKERTAQNLADFLHTPGWQRLKSSYRSIYNETPREIRDVLGLKPLDELRLSVSRVKSSQTPSFNLDQADISFTLYSSVIQDYMKFMNITSNNYIADQTFSNLGGEEEFDKYIDDLVKKEFPALLSGGKTTRSLIKMYSGSGLSIRRDGRQDNYATCALTIKLIERLDAIVTDLEARLQDIVAVVARDGGTFRNRLNLPVLRDSILAKTGTLYHTSALAGIVHGRNGVIPFGIFHQVQGSKARVRQIQDRMVRTLVDQYGGPARFNYTPKFFFPVSEGKAQ